MTIILGIELNGLILLAGIAWICAFGWLMFAAVALYELTHRKPLTAETPQTTNAPLVSVLIPSRNEAGRILEQSVRSVLAQDYEQLEVIVVNDRSTDSTEPILRSIAATDKRLTIINGVEPPAGWHGKPYALQQALEASRGQWILTVDADMVLEKEAVGAAISRALAAEYDVLTLTPYFETRSFWERVFTPAWLLVLFVSYPFANFDNPKLKPSVAFGAFMLMRREALARVGEFGAVRADALEDVRLAQLLKSSGARFHIGHAPNLARTRMHYNFREIWNYLSRCMFAGMHYSVLWSSLYILTGYVFVVAPPFIAMFGLGWFNEWSRTLLVPCLTIWGIQILALILICKRCDIPWRYALSTPIGLSLFYTALLVSTINILRGKGVTWKDRRVYNSAPNQLHSR
jgi:chlorobactene glucosyltransferase